VGSRTTSPEPALVAPSRRIVLGVTGGIAAYKAVEVCRGLVDAGVHVAPVLTADALHFVGALTFSALASEPARTSLFDGPDPIPHTRLGQQADLIVVAPATAKLIGKYAAGISDDLLTATLLATRAPVLVCPAMHTEMWEHPAVQENLATLRRRGVHILPPESGRLAGGDLGPGRLAAPEHIVATALSLVATPAGPLSGLRVLVTGGGTREAIDPVRFIGNRSSGRMADALAASAERRGAHVTLVTTQPRESAAAVEVVTVESAQQMHDAVLARADGIDVIVMAAAVADFRPKSSMSQKFKKGDGVPEVLLEPTVDILAALRDRTFARRPIVVGFAAETERLREHAATKLARKRVDLMVANDVSAPDSGFEVETNRAVLLDADGGVEELPLLTKVALADVVWDRVQAIHSARGSGSSYHAEPGAGPGTGTPG
jgi:phosphopantothenoylcysteine decarboxylase/phosphopantothenate--cysteine ligase